MAIWLWVIFLGTACDEAPPRGTPVVTVLPMRLTAGGAAGCRADLACADTSDAICR